MSEFAGFERPRANYFRLPNAWTDITASMHTWAEHKVVEYVLRHTWGFQEYGIPKRITLDEFMHGRWKADGTRMDKGTGLSKQAVIEGIRWALADGYLIEERDERDRGRIRKSYMLRMSESPEDDPEVTGGDIRVSPQATAEVAPVDSRGQPGGHRTEKETLERNRKKETKKGSGAPSVAPALSPSLDLNRVPLEQQRALRTSGTYGRMVQY